MSSRVCPCLGCSAHDGKCPTLTTGGRCAPCSAALDRARGTARERGYDSDHERLRRQLVPKAIGEPCPRCGHLMLKGQDLDLGHSKDRSLHPNARADRVEHANCNRSAGGKLGRRMQ